MTFTKSLHDDELWSLEEAACHLDISVRTLARWIASELVATTQVGRRRMVVADSARALLEAASEGGGP
jgi:hypothetical protein